MHFSRVVRASRRPAVIVAASGRLTDAAQPSIPFCAPTEP
ncbi:hypothetical protein I550_2243 [Mycobacterium intracellulare 1956]|uniref:Uncharacterized protein n=1 Tax=Mycobacterium intracellulare 1956 TaxID=1299331 RepID=X8CRS5_MYCIT|nr:hypothetical protein I550_2243 [Mycobacterium intracellulare 1956]